MALKIKGIDISRAQTDIDFAKIKEAGVKFVILRAGIGSDEDTYFRRYLEQCEKHKIPYGCYWYVKAVKNAEFRKEVKACIDTLKGSKPSYPVFFDMEEQAQIDKLTNEERTEMAKYFCQMVEKAGFPSGIYANPSWLETYYNKPEIVGKYDIWLAHWTGSPDKESRYSYGQTMWQWGITSIDGRDVDGDVCFINYPAKTSYWYKTHTTSAGNTQKPSQTTQDASKTDFSIGVGKYVTVKPNAVFKGNIKPLSFVYETKFRVQDVSSDGVYALIGLDGEPTGWMDKKYLTVVSDTKKVPTLKVGDKVKVKPGAKTYSGGSLAVFVYTQVYEVVQVGANGKSDYIVIGQNGQVTAAVKAEDLKKV